MEPILGYNVKTDTIRQMPENYLIAYRDGGGYWICNPDIAADKELATRVFLALFDFDTKWRSTGLELLAKVT